MPYRIDISHPASDVLDRLQQLGALDVDVLDVGVAAILPDRVSASTALATFGAGHVVVSAAVGRDDDSTWIVRAKPHRIGSLLFAPDSNTFQEYRHRETTASPNVIRLRDSAAFGTGHHPTTALCVEAIAEVTSQGVPDRMLDVGTGSGILALAALALGVSHVLAIDIDRDAVVQAIANAAINDRAAQIDVRHGGLDIVDGAWPLIVANVQAAPLMDMAPQLTQRLGHRGRLILSGIAAGVAADVERVFRRAGLRHVRTDEREGWAAVLMGASW